MHGKQKSNRIKQRSWDYALALNLETVACNLLPGKLLDKAANEGPALLPG